MSSFTCLCITNNRGSGYTKQVKSFLTLLLQADFTPLMFCAYHGHPKVAKALIDAGCDIHAQGSVRFFTLLRS